LACGVFSLVGLFGSGVFGIYSGLTDGLRSFLGFLGSGNRGV
jgi:hypothetical protein